MVIHNSRDWWFLVNDSWLQLLDLFYRYAPMQSFILENGKILTQPFALYLEELRANQDLELAHYLQKLFASAPDDPSIHRIKGWSELCDLCSEDHVLYEGISDHV